MKTPIYSEIMCFDIETSVKKGKAYPYHWQLFYRGNIITGRHINLFIKFLTYLSSRVQYKQLIYVHNLSYEFAFLAPALKWTNLICRDARKPILAEYNNIEFRCSYALTNMSLRAFCETHKIEEGKLCMNHDIKRTPYTFIDHHDYKYMIHDVSSLYKCLISQKTLYSDTWYSIPLTQTGYLRREVYKLSREYHSVNRDMNQDIAVQKMLSDCFVGGYAHSNSLYTNALLHDVGMVDINSAYPAALVYNKYPMTKFRPTRKPLQMIRKGMAVIMHLEVSHLMLKPHVTMPYLSEHKIRGEEVIEENGRVISCLHGHINVNDISYKILQQCYTFKIVSQAGYYAHYDYLPQVLRDYIIKLYQDKTSLKGVVERYDEYMRGKVKVNSIYGLFAQSPFRQKITYTKVTGWVVESYTTEEIEKHLKHRPAPYAWGVWTTTYTHQMLYTIYDKNWDTLIYTDTDSIKHEDELEGLLEYNASIRKKAIKIGAYATDIKGVTHYLGEYENEGVAEEFKTLGAKRYAMRMKGELIVTISGVPKKGGARQLEKMGGVDALCDELTFRETGKLIAEYDDSSWVFEETGNRWYTYSYVRLYKSDITITISQMYDKVLRYGIRRIIEELCINGTVSREWVH